MKNILFALLVGSSAMANPPGFESPLTNLPHSVVSSEINLDPILANDLDWKADEIRAFFAKRISETKLPVLSASTSGYSAGDKRLESAVEKNILKEGSSANLRLLLTLANVPGMGATGSAQIVIEEFVRSSRKKGPKDFLATIYSGPSFPIASGQLPTSKQLKSLIDGLIVLLENEYKNANKL